MKGYGAMNKTETWTVTQYAAYRNGRSIMPPAAPYNRPDVPQWCKDIIATANQPERELQAAVTGWLTLQGARNLAERAHVELEYDDYRATAPFAHREPMVWFAHLVDAERNPLLPDIVCFRHGSRPLMVELKTRNKWQRGQLEMILMAEWRLAATLDGFAKLYNEWKEVGV